MTSKPRARSLTSARRGESTSDDRDSLKARTAGLGKYGKKWDRAVDTVLAGGVKEARFLPSGRKIFAVVGRLGDEFIDPERPYCSCGNFYFGVLGEKEDLCYHLLSFQIAAETGKIETTAFSDEEYGTYLTATIRDVFEVLRKSGR